MFRKERFAPPVQISSGSSSDGSTSIPKEKKKKSVSGKRRGRRGRRSVSEEPARFAPAKPAAEFSSNEDTDDPALEAALTAKKLSYEEKRSEKGQR